MVDLRDPRVDTWPLMASIWPTTLICIIYVYVVKVKLKWKANNAMHPDTNLQTTHFAGCWSKIHGEQRALWDTEADDCVQRLPDSVQLLDVQGELGLLRDRGLQLALPTCGLFKQWSGYFHHPLCFLFKILMILLFPQALRVLRVGWWYFFSKFVDLLDTIFFIMRKKFNQVGNNTQYIPPHFISS